MVCEDCEKLEKKVEAMFDFFHDVIQDIADESTEWFEAFTKEFDRVWSGT